MIDRRRTADEVLELVAEFFEEFRVGAVARIGVFQLGQRMRERFGNKERRRGRSGRAGREMDTRVAWETSGGCAGAVVWSFMVVSLQ